MVNKETAKPQEKHAASLPEKRHSGASAGEKDPLINELLETLRSERLKNEQLQGSLDSERLRWEEREQQLQELIDLERRRWEEREQQWEEREQQWTQERDGTKAEIEDLKRKMQELCLQLKTAMGIERSSEKGSAIPSGNAGGASGSDRPGSKPVAILQEPSVHERKYHLLLKRPCSDRRQGSEGLQEWLLAIGSESELVPAISDIFGTPVVSLREEEQDFSFTQEEREQLFGTCRGLHSKREESTVYDLDILVQKTTCRREVLTDLRSGLRHAKDKSLAPKGSRLSWAAMAKIATLVAEYAFPMERLSTAIGIPYFSSANISRWFSRSATTMVYPYIALGKSLGQLAYLKTDDTSALVLKMRDEAESGDLTPDRQRSGEEWETYLEQRGETDLVALVIDAFGRVAERADGNGAKLSVNTTVISGKLDPLDHRSMVYFYRTHFGQAGNLLTRILEYRPANQKWRQLVIQGDLSSQNHVEPSVSAHLDIVYIGCASHARRAFFRFREQDRSLCFFVLRCFAIIARVEAIIRNAPMSKERVLHFRSSYSAKVWQLLVEVCQAVIAEERHPLVSHHIWKKGDRLFGACSYLVNHFPALTFYLEHAHLDPDNNSSERSLRGEKLIEGSSYFRQTERGRVSLDIHRTMIASCRACGLPYETYLRAVNDADRSDVETHPERYFPHILAHTMPSRAPPAEEEASHLPETESLH